MNKKIVSVLAVAGLALTATACTTPDPEMQQVEERASKNKVYQPVYTVELDNWNRAQEIYDDPASIQWCTLFPSNPSAPIITFPIVGKLTTSNTSYFSPTSPQSNSSGAMVNVPNRSVDGLYHGDSFYRYGFTPAGVMVDFSNSMESICQTSLTEYQRENTYLDGASAEGNVDDRQERAEEAIRNGNAEEAAKILEEGN